MVCCLVPRMIEERRPIGKSAATVLLGTRDARVQSRCFSVDVDLGPDRLVLF
jgi:hypothetical protein